MAKKPSERTNRQRPSSELNLTSLIDIITTVMFFLLIFLGMVPVVVLDAPIPKVASTAEEMKKAKETQDSIDLTVWIKKTGFTIRAANVLSVNVPKPETGDFPYKDLHEQLVKVHALKPKLKEITFIPDDDIIYDVLIQAMDAARALEKGDPGFEQIPPELFQKPESLQFNQLFPDMIIGGV